MGATICLPPTPHCVAKLAALPPLETATRLDTTTAPLERAFELIQARAGGATASTVGRSAVGQQAVAGRARAGTAADTR